MSIFTKFWIGWFFSAIFGLLLSIEVGVRTDELATTLIHWALMWGVAGYAILRTQIEFRKNKKRTLG